MSAEKVLADTGPLVALFDADDRSHSACAGALKALRGPLFTVWPAVTEAMYLLSFSRLAQDALLRWLESGALAALELGAEDMPRVRELLNKYRDLPMDFTDAAVVCAAEREGIRRIFTVDARDFRIYRPRHARSFDLLP